MKIEKISDTQIRCTLNGEDLQSRELKISELAYGTEKAKTLFQDMIEQASQDFGFQADNLPLMVEAIPLSPDCIILVITKVDDPEEFDKKFANILPALEDLAKNDDGFVPMLDTLSNNSDILNDIENIDNEPADNKTDTTGKKASAPYVAETFVFDSLDSIIRAAEEIDQPFHGTSSVYKSRQGNYYLRVHCEESPHQKAFLQYCTLLSEYSKLTSEYDSSPAFLEERCETIIKDRAIDILRTI